MNPELCFCQRDPRGGGTGWPLPAPAHPRTRWSLTLSRSGLTSQQRLPSPLPRASPAGVADQLQTNYASDLRSILKTLFQVMATKPETDDKEKLKKGEWRPGTGSEAHHPCPGKPALPGHPAFYMTMSSTVEAPSRARLSAGGLRAHLTGPRHPKVTARSSSTNHVVPRLGRLSSDHEDRPGGAVPVLAQTGPSGPRSLLQNSLCQSSQRSAQSPGGDMGPAAPGGSGPL